MAYHRSRSLGVGAKIIRRRKSLTSICHCSKDRSISLTLIIYLPNTQLLHSLAQFLHKFIPFFCVFHLGFGLVAEILTYAVERRLRRNLSFGYQRVNADLTRVRGSINFLRTECHQLLQRGRVASTYEELTVDTLRNRFVKAALLELSRAMNHRDNQKLVRKCRVASGRMARAGISDSPASMYRRRRQEFSTSRINTEDREMLAAARLAFDLSLLTEDAGASRLAMPSYEGESWALFEGAVRGFYAKNLGDKGWEVSRGSRTHWPVEPEQRTPRLILPSMQTDIVLKRPNPQHRIIVDTKFKSVMVRGRYGRETLRSGDIYQLYAYLRSQEKPCD